MTTCMGTIHHGLQTRAQSEHQIHHVYGNEAMSRAGYFEWHACFKSGRTSLDDDKRSEKPSMSSTPVNVETIRRLMHEDRQRSINNIAVIIDASYGTVQAILTSDLNMHCIATNFMPRLLIPDQKELCSEICQDLHQRALDDPTSMSRVIIGDETLVYRYNPETKQQCSQWKSPTSP